MKRTIRTTIRTIVLVAAVIGSSSWLQGGTVDRPDHSVCDSCHQSHGNEPGLTLIPVSFVDELCLRCHRTQEHPANEPPQIEEWSGSGSTHLITEAEMVKSGYEREVIGPTGQRIVLKQDCLACHQPHSKLPGRPKEVAFDARGELVGEKATFAAEICFGCHAGPEAAILNRFDLATSDIGVYFGPYMVSSHRMGRLPKDRPDLPSLAGFSSEEPLDCTSCHSNSDPRGSRGPHLSQYTSLLKGPYSKETNMGFVKDASEYLCYKCHRRDSIESNQSFPLHREHITGLFLTTGQKGTKPRPQGSPERPDVFPRAPLQMTIPMPGFGQPTPCATCHDSHGSRNGALISFDPEVVMPAAVGGPYFQRISFGYGSCTLLCHGYEHIQTTY